MDSVYILIKKSDVTIPMINWSTSKNIDCCPTYTVANPWYYFGVNTTFVLLEFTKDVLKFIPAVADYEWLEQDEVKIKLQELNALLNESV